MKAWFNWRSLRRPAVAKAPARHLPETLLELPVTAKPLQLVPKKRPVWARFARKPSPFELRPGAVESLAKGRPPAKRSGLAKLSREDSDRNHGR